MKTYLLFLFVIVLNSTIIHAQDVDVYRLYRQQTYFINPAAASAFEKSIASFSMQNYNWNLNKYSYQTYVMNGYSQLKNEKFALGGSLFYNNNSRYENVKGCGLTFASHLPIKKNMILSVGATIYLREILLSNLNNGTTDDPNSQFRDPSLPSQNANSYWKPNIDIGVLLHNKNWYTGLSATHLLNYNMLNYYITRSQYYGFIGYKNNITKTVVLEPMLLCKYNETDISAELKLNAYYKDYFWAGFTIDNNKNTAVMAGLKLERFQLAYVLILIKDLHYWHTNNKIMEHQIMLKYNFYTNNKAGLLL